MSTDHLALAREYIAKGDDYYAKAADEIIAAKKADPQLSNYTIGERLGKNESWVRRLVQSRTNASPGDGPLEVDWQAGPKDQPAAARRVLSDPEQRKQVIAALPSEQIEEVIREAHGVAMDRLHAKQAEHDAAPKAPTVRDLMGDERFDPSESWADTHIIRVREKAHILRRQVEKWGLVLGSMTEEQAFAYVEEAERNIAEVRVVLQERMGDRSRSEI